MLFSIISYRYNDDDDDDDDNGKATALDHVFVLAIIILLDRQD